MKKKHLPANYGIKAIFNFRNYALIAFVSVLLLAQVGNLLAIRNNYKTSFLEDAWNNLFSNNFSKTTKISDDKEQSGNYLNVVSPKQFDGTLSFSLEDIEMTLPENGNGSFSLDISVSDAQIIDVKFVASESGATPTWLKKDGLVLSSANNVTQSTSSPELVFQVDATSLVAGSYTATVTGSATGYTSATFDVLLTVTSASNPYVIAVNPPDNAINIPLNVSVSANNIYFPPGSILDKATVNNNNVKLFRLDAMGNEIEDIPSNVNDTGGGDAITLTPNAPLLANTKYRFKITDGVKDTDGLSFVPFESEFTTGEDSGTDPGDLSGVQFTQVKDAALGTGTAGRHTSLVIGPDGKLYASTVNGEIKRWIIQADGNLTNLETLTPALKDQNNQTQAQGRIIIGLVFDPVSTADNLIAYITHSTNLLLGDGPQWDGKITKLTGANLQNVQDLVTHLPRSVKDHLTNSLAFGPDGALYLSQGSNSAGGAYDNNWMREEDLLAGAVLRLDLAKLTPPLNARTTANQALINSAPANSITLSDGTYNPYATNSPLTIYGSGIRNAYDLVWHSNGQLYVPANGTAGGSNTPASVNGTRRPNGTFYNHADLMYPSVPAANGNESQRDWLFRIVKDGYYGHPNPLRGEYVLNRGKIDVNKYPTGTVADVNYRGAAYDFEFNKSPNGAIEYKSNSYGGLLKNKLMVVRFSGGDDIVLLEPGGANLNIVHDYTGIQGMSGFVDPLDLIEHQQTGNIYVAQFDRDAFPEPGAAKIILLKPGAPPPTTAKILLTPNKLVVNDVQGGTSGPNNTITINNIGSQNLTVSAISLAGTDASQFILSGVPALPKVLAPNTSFTVEVAFNPSSGQSGVKIAALSVNSNDPTTPTALAPLRGLATQGIGGSNEPSLQYILDAYNIPVVVGDDNPATAIIHSNTVQQKAPILGQEIDSKTFLKAGSGKVKLELLSVFGPDQNNPVVGFGWYTAGNANARNELFSVSNVPSSNAQSLKPQVLGTLDFDPGVTEFGFFSRWPYFANRLVYSEDNLNTFSGAIPHHVRVYPLKDEAGVIVPNAYVIAIEENINGFDYQDIVMIARNIRPSNKKLAFNEPSLNFLAQQDATVPSKPIILSTDGGGNPAITLTKNITSNWLVIPSTTQLGTVNIGVNTNSIAPGIYKAIVTAQAPGYESASFEVFLEIGDNSSAIVWTNKINFQVDVTPIPTGYKADIGAAYGNRGSGLFYGWADPANGSPASNASAARNRNIAGFAYELNTITHLQHANQTDNPSRIWEYAVANGLYHVKVAVGDPSPTENNSQHIINIEGIQVISFNEETSQGFRGQQFATAMVTVQVNDGKLTLNANGGTNSKIAYIWIGNTTGGGDKIPPTVALNFQGAEIATKAFTNQVVITINASDAGGSGLSKVEYSLGGAYQNYTGPITINTIGSYIITARATDGNGNVTLSPPTGFTVVNPSNSNAKLFVENLRRFPSNDLFVFSFVETYPLATTPPTPPNRDVHTIRLYNHGSGSLVINNLSISNNMAFGITNIDGVSISGGINVDDVLPVTISQGDYVEIVVAFIARNLGPNRVTLFKETLTITSNDDSSPIKTLKLNGLYQYSLGGSAEPRTQEVIDIYDFKTQTGFQSFNDNHTNPLQDEIYSPYFVRVDNTKPVLVWQLAAYHNCCTNNNVKIYYQRKGNFSATQIFQHKPNDSHLLLPRRSTTSGYGDDLGYGTFSPAAAPFSIRIDGDNTDPVRNVFQGIVMRDGSTYPTTRGVRIWRVYDADGKIVPNAYLMAHDFLSAAANLDYNDNIYYFENIKPEIGSSFYSELDAVNDDHEFGEKEVGTTTNYSLTIRSLGKTYNPAPNDPNILITKVEIVGQHADEFEANNPLDMNLSPGNPTGESTTMTVKFKPLSVGLKNAILLIHYNNAGSPLRVSLSGIATSSCYTLTLAKRIKGASNTNVTIGGKVWEADSPYRQGPWLEDINFCPGDIRGTDNDALYCTYLSATSDLQTIGYDIPVNNGRYLVRFHLAENYWTQPGKRVNNILLENNIGLAGIDIHGEVGFKAALVKDLEVIVSDGTLDLDFIPLANRPSIAAIEIYSFESNTSLTISASNITGADCGTTNGSITVEAANTSNPVLFKLGKTGTYQSLGTFSGIAPGTYSIYAKEDIPNGCEVEGVFEVPAESNTLNFSINPASTCTGANSGTATIENISGGTGPFVIKWNTSPVQYGFTATELAAGNYTVTVTDASDCKRTKSFQITNDNSCPVRINAGGPSLTTSDERVFIADDYFTGGTTYGVSSSTSIAGTVDDFLYRTERSGAMSYNISVSNGTYVVTLHFAEIFFTAANKRKFDVSIEGTQVLNDYDIFAAVGGFTAVTKTYNTTVSDGVLNIVFTNVLNQAKISAIEAINTTNFNKAPTANNAVNQTKTYTEGTATVDLDNIIVTDPDAGEQVTVTIKLLNPLTGTFTATSSNGESYNATTGTWIISNTVAKVNTALAALAFKPATNNDQNTTANVTIADGGENGVLPFYGSIKLNVTQVNNQPSANSSINQTKSYIEGDASVALDDIIVTDIDLNEQVTATLTLINKAAGSLSVNGFGETYNPTTGVWTITAHPVNVSLALTAVSFVPVVNNDVNTTVSVNIADGGENGTTALTGTINLNVTPVNDQLSANSKITQVVIYPEGASSTDIADIVISDPDTGETVTVVITLADKTIGSLSATSGNGETYNAGTGIWTITGTLVKVNAALAALKFNPVPNNEVNTTATVSVADGGENNTVPVTGTITFLVDDPKNDQLIVTNTNQTHNYTEGDAVIQLEDMAVTDPDIGEIITVTLTLSNPAIGKLSAASGNGETYNATSGVWTISSTTDKINAALAALVFNPEQENDVNATIAVNFVDGGEDGTVPVTGTITLNVTAVNDQPIVNESIDQSKTYLEGVANVTIDDIIITDVDANEQITATLTLANTATGALSAGSTNGETYTPQSGIWKIIGTVAKVNAALAAITFVPQKDNELNTFVDVKIEDGREDGTFPITGKITLNVTPVNDTPTLNDLANMDALRDSTYTIALAGIGTGSPTENQVLTVTAISNNPSLISNLTINYTNGAATGQLSFKTAKEQLGTATITITVRDNGGTENGGVDAITKTFTVTVVEQLKSEIFLPTLFSPNGDNKNDKFLLRGGKNIAEVVLNIYDKNGKIVFQTTNVAEATEDKRGWDGTKDGKDLPNGAYFWTLSGKLKDGSELKVNDKNRGTVNLIR